MSVVISIRIDQTTADTIRELGLDKREIFSRGYDITLSERQNLARTRKDALEGLKKEKEAALVRELSLIDQEIAAVQARIEANAEKVLSLKGKYLSWIQDRNYRLRRMDYAKDPRAWISDRARDHPHLLDPFFKEQGVEVTAAEVLDIMEGS